MKTFRCAIGLIGRLRRTSLSRQLAEICCVPEKAIYSSLFDPLLPFLLGAFGLKLPRAFFLLKFCPPFNTPLILMDSPFAIIGRQSKQSRLQLLAFAFLA
jgi:hypothetical protein